MAVWSAEIGEHDLITRLHPLDSYDEVKWVWIKIMWSRVLRTLGWL